MPWDDLAEVAASGELLDSLIETSNDSLSPLQSVDYEDPQHEQQHPTVPAPPTKKLSSAASVLRALKDFDALGEALAVLRDRSDNEDQCIELGDAGAITVLVPLLRNARTQPKTQVVVIQILANLAYGIQANQERIRITGGIESIVSAMLHNPYDEDLQMWGIVALQNVCAENESNCDSCVCAGAVEALLGALETFSENWTIIKQACGVFISISHGSSMRQNRIRAAGGIATLLSFLERPDASETIMESALVILTNLARENSRNQVTIGGVKGIQLILQMLHRGLKQKELGLRACGALRHLAYDERNRSLIGQQAGVQAILEFVRAHQSECSLLSRALQCLNNTVCDSLPNRTLAGNSGALQLTLSILRRYSRDATLVETGCRLLRNLIDGVEVNQRIFADLEGMKQLVSAADLHRSNTNLREYAKAAAEIMSGTD